MNFIVNAQRITTFTMLALVILFCLVSLWFLSKKIKSYFEWDVPEKLRLFALFISLIHQVLAISCAPFNYNYYDNIDLGLNSPIMFSIYLAPVITTLFWIMAVATMFASFARYTFVFSIKDAKIVRLMWFIKAILILIALTCSGFSITLCIVNATSSFNESRSLTGIVGWIYTASALLFAIVDFFLSISMSRHIFVTLKKSSNINTRLSTPHDAKQISDRRTQLRKITHLLFFLLILTILMDIAAVIAINVFSMTDLSTSFAILHFLSTFNLLDIIKSGFKACKKRRIISTIAKRLSWIAPPSASREVTNSRSASRHVSRIDSQSEHSRYITPSEHLRLEAAIFSNPFEDVSGSSF